MIRRFNESWNHPWFTMGWMSRWIHGVMNHWIKKSMIQRFNQSLNQWINGAVNQWFNESVSQEINEWIPEAPSQWILPASFLRSPDFLLCLKNMQIELSRYSLVMSGAHFADLISQKCSEHIIFFWHFEMQIELSLLCTFCRQLCQIESRNRGNRDPTSAIPGATLPQKMQGFAPESVFTREFTRFWSVICTSQLCDDGNDVWLTWWCGQHDGVNANHDHRP